MKTTLFSFTFLILIYSQLISSPYYKDIERLDSLSREYLKLDKNRALEYSLDLLRLSIQKENNELIGNAYQRLGFTYSEMGNYSEATYNYLNAINFKSKYSDNIGMGKCYSSLAYISYQCNDLNKTIVYGNKAVDLLKKEHGEFLSSAYYHIAQVYRSKNENQLALRYLLLSLNTAKRTKNLIQQALEHTHISSLYRRTLEYDSALIHDNISLQLGKQLKDSVVIARALNNIGYTYYCKKEYQTSLRFLKESIKYPTREELGNTYLSIADTYIELERIDEAEKALDSSIKYHPPHLSDLANTVSAIVKFYKNKRDFEKFSTYSTLLDKIKDSTISMVVNNKEATYKSPYSVISAEERFTLDGYKVINKLLADKNKERTIFFIILISLFFIALLALITNSLKQSRKLAKLYKAMHIKSEEFKKLLSLK